MPRKKSSDWYRNEQLKKQHFTPVYLWLCNECKILGYCKKDTSSHNMKLYEIATGVKISRSFDMKYYTAQIPLRVNSSVMYSNYAKEHLQTAYDAFHQDDFETALLHFKSVDPSGSNNTHYFLAITYFMLENYEMAYAHMQSCYDKIYFKIEIFLDECSRRSETIQFEAEESKYLPVF